MRIDFTTRSSAAKRRCDEVARRNAPGDLELREAMKWRTP
jgi:hypothetical protein